MAASMPCKAPGSRFSSFFNCTVRATPANFEPKMGRMRCDIYIFSPESFSIASETDATSTWRKPSSNAASSLGVGTENARVAESEAKIASATKSKERTVKVKARRPKPRARKNDDQDWLIQVLLQDWKL